MIEKRDGGWGIIQCNDSPEPGTWCCRVPYSGVDCCANATNIITTNVGVVMMATATISTTSAASAKTVTVTTGASGAAVAASSTSSSLSSNETCPKNNTVAVGAGVGASLGIALLASLAVLGWRENTRPKVQAPGTAMGMRPVELDGGRQAIPGRTELPGHPDDRSKPGVIYG